MKLFFQELYFCAPPVRHLVWRCVTVICTGSQVDNLHVAGAASGSEIDLIAAALKRQSSLLEQVLDLAIRALDTRRPRKSSRVHPP